MKETKSDSKKNRKTVEQLIKLLKQEKGADIKPNGKATK